MRGIGKIRRLGVGLYREDIAIIAHETSATSRGL